VKGGQSLNTYFLPHIASDTVLN